MSTQQKPQRNGNSEKKPANARNKHHYRSLNSDVPALEYLSKAPKKVSMSSRKNQVSINHLLDFQLYGELPEFHKQRSRPRRTSNHSNTKTRRHLFLHGMRFINVNYRFVVDHRANYNAQMLDPNVPVDTKDIIRILVPRGNVCPICLSDDLVAPRMITSCGHVICLTCLLSLLESEVPVHMKSESKAVTEKYRDCPLCGSVIRKKDVKPVLIENVDERFEIPKINDEVILTLMTRSTEKIFPLPRQLETLYHTIDRFPWANQETPDISQYSRFFKGDLSYLQSMYETEKELIKAAFEEDKELYQDDGTAMKLALKNIDEDIALWTEKFATELDPKDKVPKGSSDEKAGSNYFYYQTGFRASTVYVLSPLDIKVLKSSYNDDYAQLPSSIVAKVENIRYEELSADTAFTKYKYLSHLPHGTTIGFLECNWQGSRFISPGSWNVFKGDLQKRSKQSSRKFKMEEKNRRRALSAEEQRTRDFFHRENNGISELDDDSWVEPASFGSLTIHDHRELPALSDTYAHEHSSEQEEESPLESTEKENTKKLQSTVWGTQIPMSEAVQHGDGGGGWDAEEMIRRAREEMQKQDNKNGAGKKKKKKRMVLLSSGALS